MFLLVTFSVFVVSCSEKQPEFNPRSTSKVSSPQELIQKMEDKITVTNNISEWGYDLRAYQAMSAQDRRGVITKIMAETKKVHQEVGIPERGATTPLSELHQRYLTIQQKGLKPPLERYARSHYLQVMLSRYNVLERGSPGLVKFYVQELIESGCDNPILAAKCLERLKGGIPSTEYQQWKQRVLTKIDKLSESGNSDPALNGRKYKEELQKAEQSLHAE